MSYSVERTRRGLPLRYLAVPFAALLAWLFPRYELLTNLRWWFLVPLWLVLAHAMVGLSYSITALSVRRGWILFKGSVGVYRSLGSLVHLQAAFLTALAEEMVFRYVGLTWLAEHLSAAAAVVLSAAAFSALHFRLGWGLDRLLQYVDLFLFGLLLGGLVLWTESLIPAVLLHGMRNYVLRCMLVSKQEYEKLHQQADDATRHEG